MNITLRQEESNDHQAVFKVIEAAFKNVPESDQSEPFLVERLRVSEAFLPELSIVAEVDGEIIGHILLTKIVIRKKQFTHLSLTLAPVSVRPDYQKLGIGGRLIRKAHEVAQSLGFKSVVLIGHETYYPRFGYQRASKFGIQQPFEAPDKNCMVFELVEDGLKKVSGMVEYDKAFFE